MAHDGAKCARATCRGLFQTQPEPQALNTYLLKFREGKFRPQMFKAKKGQSIEA